MKPSIRIENVTKIYNLYASAQDRFLETLKLSRKVRHKEFYALRDVSFDVFPGETVGIVGKNGAGKSTLLKIITGVLSPTSGKVTLEGRVSALLELGAGFNMEYTGLQNVYLNGTILGYSHEEMEKRLPGILSFADIGEFIDQPVKSYSSGMFMRLAFSVAINVEPEILIIDEALSVGDVLFQAKCFKKIQEFKESGKTILFVSHSLNNIIQYCDRCIVMNAGVKIAEGEAPPMVDLFKQIMTTREEIVDISEIVDKYNKGDAREIPGHILKEDMILSGNYLEYGSKELEIIDFGIIDAFGHVSNIVDSIRDFQVVMRVRANVMKKDPIFAFQFKDVRGVEVTGTNTMYNRYDTGTILPGEIVEITFTQTLPLPGNEGYLLSLGCTGYEGEDFVVYHRLYDIAPMQTISEKMSVGFFDPGSEIEVRKI